MREAKLSRVDATSDTLQTRPDAPAPSSAPAARASPRLVAALAAIGLAAAALRFIGLSWGLPFAMHPDEPLILDIAERMSWGNLNPDFFHYPGFFIYQVFVLRQVVDALGGDYVDVLYAARLLSAAYGLITVGFVYLLGARIGGRLLGALAAALVALMGALTLQAHYAVTDTTATALVSATLWLSVRAWQQRSFAGLVGAAIVAGLAVSTKYSVAPICFVPWVGAMALAARRRAPLRRRVATTVVLAAVAVGAFLVTSPYTALDHRAFLRDLREEVVLQAQAQAGEHTDPLLDATLAERGVVGNVFGMYDDMGAGALLLAIGTLCVLLVGCTQALWARRVAGGPATGNAAGDEHEAGGVSPPARPDAPRNAFDHIAADPLAPLLVVVWVLLYFAMMAPAAKYGERYVVPLYPAMMLLAAVPPWTILLGENRFGRRVLALVMLAVVAGHSTVAAVSSTRLLAQRDTRLLARDWAVENLPPGSRLAREFYAPPFRGADGFRLLQPFSLTDLSFDAYCADGVDYLLLSSLNADRYRADPSRFADRLAWYDRLDAHTRLIHRVEGAGDLLRHHPTIDIRQLYCRADR